MAKTRLGGGGLSYFFVVHIEGRTSVLHISPLSYIGPKPILKSPFSNQRRIDRKLFQRFHGEIVPLLPLSMFRHSPGLRGVTLTYFRSKQRRHHLWPSNEEIGENKPEVIFLPLGQSCNTDTQRRALCCFFYAAKSLGEPRQEYHNRLVSDTF